MFKQLVLFALLAIGQVVAVPTPLKAVGERGWTASIDAQDPGVGDGNGVVLTPDGESVIATSVGGTVSSFTIDGIPEWDYTPMLAGVVRSHSHVVFTTADAASPYMVYSVVTNENSPEARSHAIALDMDGNELWIQQLQGVAEGSPVISNDGGYVMLTHNSNTGRTGHFSVLDAADDGGVFYSMSNATYPFSPIGIYHTPLQGYYDGGEDNTNDMLLWLTKPRPDERPLVNDGGLYGFQFPIGFDGGTAGVEYLLLGGQPRTYKAITAPVLSNQGLSAYMAVTRSRWVVNNGQPTFARFYLNRGATGNEGFTEDTTFRGQSCYASIALSSTDPPILFGGTATPEFARAKHDLSELVARPTGSLVKSQAKVDPEDRIVYFVESSGVLHAANFEDASDAWTLDLGVGAEGEFAMDADGKMLYIGGADGSVTAVAVSEGSGTPEPSSAPSVAEPDPSPTVAPAGGPEPTAMPVPDVTREPTTTETSAGSQVAMALTFFAGVASYLLL